MLAVAGAAAGLDRSLRLGGSLGGIAGADSRRSRSYRTRQLSGRQLAARRRRNSWGDGCLHRSRSAGAVGGTGGAGVAGAGAAATGTACSRAEPPRQRQQEQRQVDPLLSAALGYSRWRAVPAPQLPSRRQAFGCGNHDRRQGAGVAVVAFAGVGAAAVPPDLRRPATARRGAAPRSCLHRWRRGTGRQSCRSWVAGTTQAAAGAGASRPWGPSWERLPSGGTGTGAAVTVTTGAVAWQRQPAPGLPGPSGSPGSSRPSQGRGATLQASRYRCRSGR